MNLQQLRLKRHMTQKELAEKTGLALVTIQKLEQGASNPSLPTIQKLAKELNYSLNVILKAVNNSKK